MFVDKLKNIHEEIDRKKALKQERLDREKKEEIKEIDESLNDSEMVSDEESGESEESSSGSGSGSASEVEEAEAEAEAKEAMTLADFISPMIIGGGDNDMEKEEQSES